ncbi:hypothetical protein WMY93_031539 [Mugilogobius chulae]|uniref:SEA domain-containing protein n=1 Tax=Mugilogobius chulae TaxID=88201 RepID=A0AAW0MM06_9GOBI
MTRLQISRSSSKTHRHTMVKPMLNKKQMQKRLKWVKQHSEWTAEDWQKVVFSDESRFCISFGDQGLRVWRRGGETYNHECVKRSVKFPQSVMVWGCMSARGVGKLCFLKKTVNAAVYQDVLETFLIPTVEEQFGEEDFIFQQDLAPAHAAKSTKDWFTRKQLEVLAWPANSPDLNVIENLWAIIKRKIRDRKPTKLDQLKQNIATAWEAVMSPSEVRSAGLSLDLNQDFVLDWSGLRAPHGSLQTPPQRSQTSPQSVQTSVQSSVAFSSDELISRSDSGKALIRRKRNILFPNGVKLCNRETYEQVVHNHLQYFYLRVCQETVWEAFRVFWGSDIGLSFSRADEHHRLIMNRLGSAVNSSAPDQFQTEDSPKQVEDSSSVQVSSKTSSDPDLNQDLDQDHESPAGTSPGTSDSEIPTDFIPLTFTIQQEIQDFLQTTSQSPLESEKDVLSVQTEMSPTEPPPVEKSPPEDDDKVVPEETVMEPDQELQPELKPGPEKELDQDLDQELEPEPEQEPEKELEPEPEKELNQELEPELEPEKELDQELEPEQELDQEPEQRLYPEPGQEPEAEPEQEPEQELDQELEPEQEPDQEPEQRLYPEPGQEPEAEPESEQEPEQELDQKLDQKLELEQEPEQEPEKELDHKSDPEQVQETEHEPEQGQEKEPEQEQEPERKTVQETEHEPEQGQETEPELGLEPGQKPDQKLEPELDQVPEQELDQDLDREPQQGQEKEPELDQEPGQKMDKEQGQETEQELDQKLKPELDQESEKDLDQEPEQKPDKELDQEPEQEPEKEKELDQEPGQKTDKGQGQETEKESDREPELEPGQQPEPEKEPELDQKVDEEVDLEEKNNFGLEDEDTLGNEIGVTLLRPLNPLKDQILDLSLRLREETYTDALRNPSSVQYQRLERVFIRKIVEAFERLPGFKRVQVVEFRPQKDLERGLVVSVHYAVTLEVDTGGVSNDTLDFIALQSNFVEKNYPRAEQPTVLYTITDFRNYITEALHSHISENLLPSAKPTTQPTDDFDNMDNILAAEKPPDAPDHESETELFLKKEDFLLDFSKPKDEPSVSENDVMALDETTEALREAGAASLWNQDSDPALGLKPVFPLDDGSGSGFSGDGPVQFSPDSDPNEVKLLNSDTLPPPDLETTEDESDEISVQTQDITTKESEPTEAQTSKADPTQHQHQTEASTTKESEPTEAQTSEPEPTEAQTSNPEPTQHKHQTEASTTEITQKVEDVEATKADLVPKVEEITQITTSTIKLVPEIIESSSTAEPSRTFTTESPGFSTEGTVTFELFGPNTETSESDNDFFFAQTVTEETAAEKTTPKYNEKDDKTHPELSEFTTESVNISEEKEESIETPKTEENLETVSLAKLDEEPTQDFKVEPEIVEELNVEDPEVPELEISPPKDVEILEEQLFTATESVSTNKTTHSGLANEDLNQDQVLAVTLAPKTTTTVTTSAVKITEKESSDHEVKDLNKPPEISQTTTTVAPQIVQETTSKTSDLNVVKPDVSPTEAPKVHISRTTTAKPQETTKMATEASPYVISEPEKDSPFTRISDSVPEYEDETPVSTPTLTTEPLTKEPLITEPLTKEPLTTEPITTEPLTKEPLTTEPLTKELLITEPLTKEPLITEPPTKEPLITEPLTKEPLTTEPLTKEPLITEPLTKEPLITVSPASFEDKTSADGHITSTNLPTTGLNIGKGLTLAPTVESIEVIPEILTQISPIVTSFEPILSKETNEQSHISHTQPKPDDFEGSGLDLDVIEEAKLEIINPGVEKEAQTLSESLDEITEESKIAAEMNENEILATFSTILTPQTDSTKTLEAPKLQETSPTTSSSLETNAQSSLEISPTTAPNAEVQSSRTATEQIKVQTSEVLTVMSSDLPTQAPILETSATTKAKSDSGKSVGRETNVVLAENSLILPTVEPEMKIEESLKTAEEYSKTSADVNKESVPLSTTVPNIKLKTEDSNVELLPTKPTQVESEENLTKEIPVFSSDVVETVETPTIIPDSSPENNEIVSEIVDSDSNPNDTDGLFSEGFPDSHSIDVSFGLVPLGPEGSGGSDPGHQEVVGSIPGVSDSLQTRPEKPLTVFFSLRVTNMVFSPNLFNKSSEEYRRLEQKFTALLVPFLESKLNNFQELQILNFQNGSVVVNSRLRFVTPVRRGLTTAVYLLLKDFAVSAQRTEDLRIDRSSLDVESGNKHTLKTRTKNPGSEDRPELAGRRVR